MDQASEEALSNEAPINPPSEYQHQPLDRTKSSIRLLKIHSCLSEDGLVSCEMWHDDISAVYVCLSYVWGPDDDQRDVLVNGKLFRVRKNLWDFLYIARNRFPSIALWIDALAIDQFSIAERNHQVAQMGQIYSHAQEVICWLGHNPAIQRALSFCMRLRKAAPSTEAEAWEFWETEHRVNDVRTDWKQLAEHKYWTRAWITQEILLSRRYKMLVGKMMVSPTTFTALNLLLPGINKRGWAKNPAGVSWDSDMRRFNTYMEILCKKKTFENRPILELLHELPRRECKIPRDRIYSLLALATDAKSIPVDYASSQDKFMLQILEFFRSSMCLCLWTCISGAIPLKPNIPFSKMLQLEMSALRGDRKDNPSATRRAGSCRHCGIEVEDEGWRFGGSRSLICARQLCDRAAALHFWLAKGASDHYTISIYRSYLGRNSGIEREASLPVVSVKRPHTEFFQTSDINRSKQQQPTDQSTQLIQLTVTANTLNSLLRLHMYKVDYNCGYMRLPLEICENARRGNGCLTCLNTGGLNDIIDPVESPVL